MTASRCLKVGGGLAAVFGLLCCVTPLLPIVLGAVGAGSVVHYIYTDSFLLLFAGAGLAAFGAGVWLGQKTHG